MSLNEVEAEKGQIFFEIGKKISNYVYEYGVKTVCFLDSSARPAYVAFKAYWRDTYPAYKLPIILFLNPRGLVSKDDFTQGTFDWEILSGYDEKKYGASERFDSIRNESEVIDSIKDFNQKRPEVGEPILLFDTCIHGGRNVQVIIEKLKQASFSDIRVGVVSNHKNSSKIEPSLVVMNEAYSGMQVGV